MANACSSAMATRHPNRSPPPSPHWAKVLAAQHCFHSTIDYRYIAVIYVTIVRIVSHTQAENIPTGCRDVSWCVILIILQWWHNGRDGVSNHQHQHCFLNRLFRRRSKKTSKLRVTGLCAGNSPVTGEFPAQVHSNGENVSIWWRHLEQHTCQSSWMSFYPKSEWAGWFASFKM